MAGRVGVVEDAELGGRHVGMAHELLGEDLAGFELGRLLRRAEDAQPGLLEGVDDALRQRLFRADDGQADLFLLGEADQGVEVVDVDGDVDAVLGGAGVAGGAVNTRSTRGDWASFQTRACSRPPLPMTRTFMLRSSCYRGVIL